MRALRPIVILVGLIALWQAVVWSTGVEPFILPPPAAVARDIADHAGYLAVNGLVTLSEILIGLGFGIVLGCASAILMAWSREARDWLLPVLVTTQAVPVFALAPVLVLWMGYGIWPKVAMATLLIYFPVTAAFFDGIRRTDPLWLDLARAMTGNVKGARWSMLLHVRLPAALPALGSGVRVAAATAPIGAVVGEWVGSSNGLGYAMWHAKNQMDAPGMFAALIVLCALAVALYFLIDAAVTRLMPWQPESHPTDI
jgi:putative hydroxymethylpyrimidine transport system permease protein